MIIRLLSPRHTYERFPLPHDVPPLHLLRHGVVWRIEHWRNWEPNDEPIYTEMGIFDISDLEPLQEQPHDAD